MRPKSNSRDLSLQFEEEGSSAAPEEEDESIDTPALEDADDSCDGNVQDVILEDRAAPSLGATNHVEDTCKPCAWNWKPAGCSKGSDCDFCHLCDEGAVRQRRRAKIARLRAEEKAARRAKRLQPEQAVTTCESQAVKMES
jgi:hypothetical protein